MHWLGRILVSSIGKKLLMAVTGTAFVGFLCIHLAGNLTLYGGEGLFNSYVEHLHALGPLIPAAEWILVFLAAVHVGTGLVLFLENRRARPQGYHLKKRAGGRTLSSATMPYTGFLILLFVVFHLVDFHFADRTGTTLYHIVAGAFSNPLRVAVYVVVMAVVAVHVSHGFWSLFQTLGLNHPKYMGLVERAGLVISLVFGIGFGSIPLFVSLFAHGG